MIKIFNKILETDWIGYLYRKYKDIPETDRKIFWILFISVNLMFCFHTIHFLWGQDDWKYIKYQRYINSHFLRGRFSADLLKYTFFQGQLLPIINNTFAFIGFTLGVIFLFKYWELENRVKYFVIAGLIFMCNPLVNAWLFFQHVIIENLWVILFVVLGLDFAVKERKKRFFLYDIFSVLFLFISISIYQPCINTIFIILFGKLFIKSVEGKFNDLIFIFKKSFFSILISFILYTLIYKICLTLNLIDIGYYNVKRIYNLSLFFEHIKLALNSIYTELFNYERILYPKFITELFSVIFIFAIISCLFKIFSYKDKLLRFIISFCIFFLLLFSTQIAQIFAEYDVYGEPRIIFYGILFLNIFILVLILKYANIKLKNITYLICFILFIEYITVNFVSQKSFKFATSEVLKLNKVIERIEQNENFLSKKIYDIFIIGIFYQTRDKYVGKFYLENDNWKSWELGSASYINLDSYIPLLFYNQFVFQNDYKYNYFKINIPMQTTVKFKSAIYNLTQWPNINSLIIYDNLIMLNISNKSLEEFKQYLKSQ